MPRRFCVDTSAYLCILLGEAGHVSLRRQPPGAELLSSFLLVLEAERNLARLLREGLTTAAGFHHCVSTLEDDLQHFALRDLSLDLCTSRTMPVVSTSRSLDPAQLRTALWFHEQEGLSASSPWMTSRRHRRANSGCRFRREAGFHSPQRAGGTRRAPDADQVVLASLFGPHRLPYRIIGGQAVLLYGEPRLTKDIDITLGAGLDPLADPEKFTRQTRVLPCSDQPPRTSRTKNGRI